MLLFLKSKEIFLSCSRWFLNNMTRWMLIVWLRWLLVLIGVLWLVEANKKSIYDRYGKEGLTGSSGGRGEWVTLGRCLRNIWSWYVAPGWISSQSLHHPSHWLTQTNNHNITSQDGGTSRNCSCDFINSGHKLRDTLGLKTISCALRKEILPPTEETMTLN